LPEAPVPSVYVPSPAERPEGQRRMPRTEGVPVVARPPQEREERAVEEPRNARALFKRLASNVGLNLKPSSDGPEDDSSYTASGDAAARNAIEAGYSRGSQPAQAPEAARGQRDPNARQQPQANAKEHLEIPAFLRKHG
jgi:cell division protein FtsZ